jgi:hypothetical protein
MNAIVIRSDGSGGVDLDLKTDSTDLTAKMFTVWLYKMVAEFERQMEESACTAAF